MFLASTFVLAGLILLIFATRISTWKTMLWQRFYTANPTAAAANPLSKYAGSEKSVKTGALLWRVCGALLLLNGLFRLATGAAPR